MNVVSFETAKKLKEAGFPQPIPTFGQMWYSKLDMSPMVFIKKAKESDLFIFRDFTGDRVNLYESDFLDVVFAPTATDILHHLPGLNIAYLAGLWITEDDNGCESHESPAEAAALAWLEARIDRDSNLVKMEPEE